ncbi:MAG: translational GTPase TypA [Ruminococcus sp.]|uniref:translational GTPase TypA n=1 Tax=Ruminococcus sp. TaxID=41978 RepID=UPI001B474896|nr:translational GTPase TypA [Ruminococcus sp.]MBO4494190.1 translational GTPase TypA [Ruminococcus sp.]MBP5433283.1 translational GTPase TypA [Ruminococcus sp.]
MIREDLRNIAIIAHVDHGKTTLVDEMLKQGGVFRENQAVAERVMDSNDLERERGITILAKNTSVMYNGTKINIIDTPGHADFGGEVERVLEMVDGVLLLVDAAEGPMPQTRFVLSKALEMGHKIIIVVNKIDRPDARLDEIGDEVLELLLDLDANEEQLESPLLFCSGRSGTASLSQYEAGTDLKPLFDTIINYIEPPKGEENDSLQMLISSIDYNEYVGRIGIGRIVRGKIAVNQQVTVCDYTGSKKNYNAKIVSLLQIQGLNRVPVQEAQVGDIVWISGIENITIGDTICATDNPDPLPFVKISEPTVEMTFSVNDSPFAGREGKFVTSRQLRERLFRELLKDVSLRVEETESTDAFRVAGRGEMHLSILIENMRREGYELGVSTPRVLYRTDENGRRLEPIERLVIDVPEDCVGSVMEKIGTRKGDMVDMHPQGSRMRIEFLIPARGLFGYKSEFLTDTKGEGIMSHVFDGYQPYKGDIERRNTGSLISFETGEAVTYGLYNAQERGQLFITSGTPVYEGMVVGASPKTEDLVVNVCKKKHLTNTRASGSDDALRLVPPRVLSLEDCLEFLADDELLEVTPESLRIRKRVLSNTQRAKERGKKA